MVASPEPVHPAAAFLQLLGKDPAQTWFRILRPKKDRRRHPTGGRDSQGLHEGSLRRLNFDNRNGWSVYFVTGNASTASGVNKKTGLPTGAVWEGDITSCPCLFVEWDDKPIEWQINAWRELGLPEPTVQVLTGGKSVHNYWVLREPMPPDQWRALQARLIAHCGSDTQCQDPCRVMRLPGFLYINKTTGKPTRTMAEVVHSSTTRYSPDQIAACLPAVEPPAPAANTSRKFAAKTSNLPPRPLDQIEAAARFIPERVEGGNTYEQCRNALCGCAAALAAIGQPEEKALDLLASKWPDRATAEQVLGSTTTREPASFWRIAADHGFDLSRHDRRRDNKVVPLRSQQPAQAAAQAGGAELPYLPAIAKGIPDGWIPRKDGSLSRMKIESGDLSGLLRRSFPGRLTFNLLTMAAEANGQEIKEADVDDCAVLLSEKGYKVTDQVNCAALLRVAREHSYDPVKQYLEAVASDSLLQPADLGAAAATYLNASDPLYSAMLRAWLIGAVARIFDPGCQMDYCLVLQSSVQGLFKSTFFKTLASPDWFTSSIPEAEKDFLLNVHRCWIFELAELDSYTSKRDAGRVKNIITTTTDFLRVPYGKATEPRLRRSVFASTCNRDDFLKDDTGSRRFWIIPITRKIDCNRVLQDRDAIWKAAVLAYRSGALPMLTDEQQALSDDHNRGYTVQDPWMGMLVRWLRGESLMERRDGDPASVSPEQPFTTAEALYSAGIRRPSAIVKGDETNLGPLLKELGFEKRRVSSGRDRAYRWFRREG